MLGVFLILGGIIVISIGRSLPDDTAGQMLSVIGGFIFACAGAGMVVRYLAYGVGRSITGASPPTRTERRMPKAQYPPQIPATTIAETRAKSTGTIVVLPEGKGALRRINRQIRGVGKERDRDVV